MKIYVLIVEDEVLVAKVIKHQIEKAGYICAGIAVDYQQALDILNSQIVDIALLDINISSNKSGIDIAHYINKNYYIPIIFLTAYSDRATIDQIKETNPYGYLKKPIDEDNLLVKIEIVLANFKQKKANQVQLRVGTSQYFFQKNELIYLEAEHVYVTLNFVNKKLIVRSSLTELLAQLPPNLIKQVNRSVAINPHYIDKISQGIIYLQDKQFKISPAYKHLFQ